MKKIIISLIGLLATAAIFLAGGYAETHYTKSAVVTSVVGREIRVRTDDGNTWECHAAGFQPGNSVIVTFDNNHTELNIYDDSITNIRMGRGK